MSQRSEGNTLISTPVSAHAPLPPPKATRKHISVMMSTGENPRDSRQKRRPTLQWEQRGLQTVEAPCFWTPLASSLHLQQELQRVFSHSDRLLSQTHPQLFNTQLVCPQHVLHPSPWMGPWWAVNRSSNVREFEWASVGLWIEVTWNYLSSC